MVLWNLFVSFIKIGFVSFGGGYAMIPVIQYEVEKHGWLSVQQFTDVIAISGMSPGPIAANAAVFVGYKAGGISGAIIAILAISVPSLIIVLLVSLVFTKVQHQPMIQSAFYGLRPVITGMIIFAAVQFAIQNNLIGIHHFHVTSLLFLFVSLGLLLFTRLHPAFVILLSGIAGIIVYF
ncbi:chromate transporter [Fictibacillus sp. Mic-4]|uniref:chromate transporter n=1 Tax=Fictibacillus TaxID=1329200 RepID=UPI000412D3A4|nr:chromate transporter [Fictibacillus gelatini]